MGLHWLRSDVAIKREDDADAEAADVDAAGEDGAEGKSIYLTMPSTAALKSLLSQWKKYSTGSPATPEWKGLWQLFGYLKDLRTWAPRDRLDPQISAYVERMLAADPDRPVVIEIDFWYRTESERRDQSLATLRKLLDVTGGAILDEVEIPEIQYQGALVRVTAAVAKALTAGEDALAKLDDVMTIRPQSMYHSSWEEGTAQKAEPVRLPEGRKQCLAVMLDGYPVDRHESLRDRLLIREVDVVGTNVPVAARFHGTAMASLILNGDLDVAQPINRPLGVIPVLSVDGYNQETTPPGLMPIGVVYRALKVLGQAIESRDADLGSAFIINHSICDELAPFVRRSSPWSALLDYFALRYNTLFLVSAGNIRGSFTVDGFADLKAFESAKPADRENAIIKAVQSSKGMRGILSPAEAMNGITVGAVHWNHAAIGTTSADPYPTIRMPNLACAIGHGANQSVKPEILVEGGRFLAGCQNLKQGGIEVHAKAAAALGHRVAAPSPIGDLRRTSRTSGTSNATALATRSCHFIADALDEALEKDWQSKSTRAVVVKALLTHGCRWGDVGDHLEQHFEPSASRKAVRRRDEITRFLGFGEHRLDEVISGANHRITLLADDLIAGEQRHEYRLPIPACLLDNRVVRSLTLTLAWMTPHSNRFVDTRGVVLKVCSSSGLSDYWDGVGRIIQPSAARAARGTLIHAVLTGKKRIKSAGHPADIAISVQAMAKNGFEARSVPYALALTVQMAQPIRSTLYQDIRDVIQIRARDRVQQRQRAR